MGLAYAPPEESDYDFSVRHALRQRLIPILRSFASSLRVWEAAQVEYDALTESSKIFTGNETIEELRKIVKTPAKIEGLERYMRKWNIMVSQIVLESERLRKELDSNGPQDEVEYWKLRASRLAILHKTIHSGEMKFTIFCLQLAGSDAIKVWRALDQKVTFCFTEAKDNSAYIDRIDKITHSLYLDNPVRIKGDTHCLLQTVMMIQSTSMYYNSSERISHLLVKVK
jgi:dynein heavy chain